MTRQQRRTRVMQNHVRELAALVRRFENAGDQGMDAYKRVMARLQQAKTDLKAVR